MAIPDDDRAIIEGLRQAGADLSQPREVRHYLYVPDQRIAEFLVPHLIKIGFAVTTSPAATGDTWLVLISGLAMVTEEEIADARATLEGLAAKVRGTYDGWEAAATP